MRFANTKGMAFKGLLGTLAMGAIMFAGTTKAQAEWGIGVQIGAPVYGAAPYYGGGDDDDDGGYYAAPPVVYGGYPPAYAPGYGGYAPGYAQGYAVPYGYGGGYGREGDRHEWHERMEHDGFRGREGWGHDDRGRGWGREDDHRR